MVVRKITRYRSRFPYKNIFQLSFLHLPLIGPRPLPIIVNLNQSDLLLFLLMDICTTNRPIAVHLVILSHWRWAIIVQDARLLFSDMIVERSPSRFMGFAASAAIKGVQQDPPFGLVSNQHGSSLLYLLIFCVCS
ncbi:hypothetical protein GWI33_009786 [Rhynchophorus ferrugineus]|uniref:Uncharacterized protein n=1 Tax=Rhynchophorus ferrugineus TaxID=354439 RepID=A0A834J243_RHYFE|nr:hypothetical protein GWI33_009786 [Rhynchophorus ferrugineus]